MELVIPISQINMDFDFNSTRNSPYPSPPSTPRGFGAGDYFFSAPTSPTHMSEFYRELIDDELSTIMKGEEDFAFDISEKPNRGSLSAEELFDGGIIKPLTPPPISPDLSSSVTKSPKSSSPKISQLGKKIISTLSTNSDPSQSPQHKNGNKNRGIRGRTTTTTTISSSNSGRREARSLSPLRVSQYPWEEDQQQQSYKQQQPQQQLATASKQGSFGSSSSSSSSSNKGSKKWRLKDFLLFRSSSDGRAYEKDPLRKYSITSFKKHEDHVKNTNSFNSSIVSSSGTVPRSSRGKGKISAHELHYTVNKAVSQEMKKKTFLPYKQGILGRLSFNPAVSALANGFGSFTRT